MQSRLMKLMEKKDSLAEISKALQKQDHLTAIKLCDKQLQNKPKNRLELLKLKGELLEILGDYDKAITLYEELLKERSILWASLGLGRIQYCQRHFEQAKAVFENLIKENAAFVTAYDWLAKTLEKLGDSKQSQKVLTEAVAKSPKTILRQRSLAEISFKNRDFDTSESAFKKAVRIGKNSCYKNPTDYTGLAKTLVEKDSPIEALKVVASIKQEFHENTGADLQAAVLEGMIYQRQDQREQCEKAINKALDHYSKQPDGLSHEVTMDLAKVCFSAGQKEKGHELIKQLICDHHENEDILSQAKQLYSDVGMEQEGNDLISLAYKEVVEINNRGVKLATEGKFEESIELFVKAAKAMPNNLTINLNAAQTLIMQMQKTNSSKSDPNLAGIYLDRVRTINPANEKLQKLTAILNTLKSN